MPNRREFLGGSAVAATAAASPEALLDARYAAVKGFNYVPSYAATIWDALDLFDAPTWDREFGYSRRFRANALRIWCDFISYQKAPAQFLKAWDTALGLAAKHGLKLLITTANRWVDARWQYGQLDVATLLAGRAPAGYLDYLKAFVGAFRDHPQVLMWDLCNEPFSYWTVGKDDPLLPLLKERELGFWRSAIEAARAAGPRQPLTLGIHSLHYLNPEAVYDLVDVISCHPYAGWWEGGKGFQDVCDEYVRIANRKHKPLICSETCQGSKDNRRRTEIIRVSLRELERRRIGWLAWQLMAGKIVTARWDRTDGNCAPGDQSVMYWVETDGRTRPGHEEAEWRNWS